MAVAWKPYDQEEPDEPFKSLEPIEFVDGRPPGTYILIGWKDETMTWETRTSVRRLIDKTNKNAHGPDTIIWHRAIVQEKKYKNWQAENAQRTRKSTSKMRSKSQRATDDGSKYTIQTLTQSKPRSKTLDDLYENNRSSSRSTTSQVGSSAARKKGDSKNLQGFSKHSSMALYDDNPNNVDAASGAEDEPPETHYWTSKQPRRTNNPESTQERMRKLQEQLKALK